MKFGPLPTLTVAVLAFSALVTDVHRASAALPKMYWSDRGANTIRRADVDGTNVEILMSGTTQVRGVAVDFDSDTMYWNDNGEDRIQRAAIPTDPIQDGPVDATTAGVLIDAGLNFPAGIDLDVAGGKMYWADASGHKIQRANLDGSNAETLVDTGLDSSPYYVRLDLTSDHLYWTDFGVDKIQRANLDGSGVVDLVTTGLQLPRGLDLDLINRKMYWADRGTDLIQRADLDGSNIETLHQATPSSAAPHGVAVDVERGHVYWVDNGLVTIKRSNLDGSQVTEIFGADSGHLVRPWEIVLDFGDSTNGDCDLNGDGICDVNDIDGLTRAIIANSQDLAFDLNGDKKVDTADREVWVVERMNTFFGDANLDGEFNSEDIVSVFRSGKYEESPASDASWSEGDWDADLRFGSSDIVLAFQTNSFEQGPRAAGAAVPEPAHLWHLVSGVLLLLLRYRTPATSAISA